ncbi:ETEC_3214 domain-containing protein [Pseudarthrobacter phenanthrenivorans]|uniref:ETEC_3214 domain-containing protein n=1 Tax=Pseudarthrobacter phenanthrenivorans TaxID=361575 RepID=UPI00344D5634
MDFVETLKLVGAFLAALIASRTIWSGVRRWYVKGWGSRRAWREMLNLLTNWADDDYIKDLLGTPVFRHEGRLNHPGADEAPDWIDRIYSTPHAWVVTRSIKQRVECWSVTVTDPKFWWDVEDVTFQMTKGRLGRATFAALVERPSGRYAQRGARRYDYAEGVYLGNPGAHQNFVFMYHTGGVGDLHPSEVDVLKTGSFARDVEVGDPHEPSLEETRQKTTVNTIIVLSPTISPQDLVEQSLPVADADLTRLFHPYRKIRGPKRDGVMKAHGTNGTN